MNNEPVAWMFQGAFDISTYVSFEKPNPDIYPNPTPLYTHPAEHDLGIAEAIGFDKGTREMKIPYNDAVGKTFEDAELVSDSNVDLYKWISPKPLTEDESNMPVDSLATWAMHQANLGWSGNHGAFLHKIAITLKKQQAEIDTYKLQNNNQIDTYRHKELTDEEIDMLVHEYNCIDDYPHEFVRACLRKAQEK